MYRNEYHTVRYVVTVLKKLSAVINGKAAPCMELLPLLSIEIAFTF